MQLHRLKNTLELCLGVCIFVLLTGSSTGSAIGSFSEDDVNTRDVTDWSKRRWDMRRLGRGLNMLRLGKRDSETSLRLGRSSSPASSADDDVASRPGSVSLRVSDQLLAILKEVMEQQAPRDETRRQPPLPRYGRRSVGLARRNLGSGSNNRMFPFDFSAEDDPVYRPPPRGGRYKRAVTGLSAAQQTAKGQLPAVYFPAGLIADSEARQRSVALPRIGRYIQESLHDMRPKAVPRPRIGRDELPATGTGSSKQAGTDSDPMADPRGV